MRRTLLATVLSVVPAFAQHTLSTHEYFYIGGRYTGPADSQIMSGQMYVEVLKPQRVSRKYPLVLFH